MSTNSKDQRQGEWFCHETRKCGHRFWPYKSTSTYGIWEIYIYISLNPRVIKGYSYINTFSLSLETHLNPTYWESEILPFKTMHSLLEGRCHVSLLTPGLTFLQHTEWQIWRWKDWMTHIIEVLPIRVAWPCVFCFFFSGLLLKHRVLQFLNPILAWQILDVP